MNASNWIPVVMVIAGLAILIILAISVLLDSFTDWQSDRKQAHYEAAMKAWQIHQAEYEAEQRIRAASKAALEQMVLESRKAKHSE